MGGHVGRDEGLSFLLREVVRKCARAKVSAGQRPGLEGGYGEQGKG